MPGVIVTTGTRTGPSGNGIAIGEVFFMAAECERGIDTEAVLVTSLGEFVTAFGGYVSATKYAYQQARVFFEEGGSAMYVASISGSGVRASKVLAAEPSAPGVTLTAVGKGTWGNSIKVDVVNNDTDATITVRYGADDSLPLFEYTGSCQEIVDAVNNSTVLANYCTAALTTSANGADILSTSAVSAFTLGTYVAATSTERTAALALFTPDLGPGAVAVPGLYDGTDTTEYDAIMAHCVANNRIGLVSFAPTASISAAKSVSTAYQATDPTGQEHLAFYYPNVVIPSGTGVNLSVPPEAYVAAVRARTVKTSGAWRAYAGVVSESRFVTGIATAVSRADGDLLDADRVNAIRIINGSVRIYGARSHSTVTSQWRFITNRDTMNYVVYLAEEALEPLVFSGIDGRGGVYLAIRSALQGVLEPIRQAGGFFEMFDTQGRKVDSGYTITVDDSLNPLAQLETGLIKARVGVRVSSVGDKIDVNIIKSNLTSTLV
jgi:phage tail sheath protein FI